MVRRGSSTNIANGVLSALTLACGVIFSILIAETFRRLLGGHFSSSSAFSLSSPIWSIGFAYIVPGVLGIIATAVVNKGMYIVQMVFCILTLVVMAIFFIVGILALTAMSLFSSYTSGCRTVGNSCSCSSTGSATISGITCEDLTTINGMSIGAVVMMVLGWIVTLIACILGGILACSREDSQPGIVYQPQPSVTVMQLGHMGGQPQHGGYVVQSGYSPQPVQGYTSPGYEIQNPGYAGYPSRHPPERQYSGSYKY